MSNAGLPCSDDLIADGKLHRYDVQGDRPKSGAGWYVLFDDMGFQAGSFGSWKTGEKTNFCSKSPKEFSAEEKALYKSQMAVAKLKREAEQAKVEQGCRDWCAKVWPTATKATDDHPYLVKKGVPALGLKMYKDSLMVPLRAIGDNTIHGIQFISPDGTKKFKTGTNKKGKYFKIGKSIDNTGIICEGFATGASIHISTGYGILVAFDAGNLKPVAEAFRACAPEAKIILAADDDQWTAGNPGITNATDAAKAVRGSVVRPRFRATETKPTDFNDLYSLAGATAVKVCVFPPPVAEYEPYQHDDEDAPPIDFYSETSTPNPFQDFPFQILGYDKGDYYYLPHGTRQIKTLKATEHTKANLVELAPLGSWEMSDFNGGKSGGMDVDKTMNALLATCQRVGVYDPDKIRGRGAWFDDGRSVVHVGDSLIVDSAPTPMAKFRSEFIYEKSIKMEFKIGGAALTNTQAMRLEHVCNALSWQRPEVSGKLLAGWCALSAVCGALKWRPHIQITGGAGTGKSWIIDNIVRPVAGPGALIVQGATSEAGIRQCLGADSRPVIFDEAEGEDQRAHIRMQSILELARQASSESGGSIYKGSTNGKAQAFRIRSMFCFASIGMSQTQQADQSRVSVLTLKNKHDGGKHWKEVIVPLWKDVITADFCSALRARLVRLLPTIVENAAIFSDAVGTVMGDKRAGDQLGALLAGDWALRSTNLVTVDDALRVAKDLNWIDHKSQSEQSDELRCLYTMMETLVRMPSGENASIAELVRTASEAMIIDEVGLCQAALKNHGFKAVQGGFCVANQHSELKKIMERTPWPANWSQILGRLPGAAASEKTIWFSGGSVRAVVLPITYITGE